MTDLAELRRLAPLAGRRRLPRRLPARPSATAKVRFADWVRSTTGQAVDPDTHLRLPGEAHPRVQAAAPERAPDRRALRPAAGEPRPRHGPADVLLRRQGGARLPAREGHHQVPQQPRRHDRRRSGRARPAQGRVPAGLLRLARRAPDPRQRRLESDLDRRLRGERHQQHEVHDERRADDRHARRRDDRDGGGGGRGELLPVRPHRGAGGRQPRLVQPAVALRARAGDARRARPRSSPTTSAANEPGVFEPLRDALLTRGDYYMHLADLRSYLEASERLGALYADPEGWARKAILNVAASGKFSSDRTIAEYAAEIWNAKPCVVP